MILALAKNLKTEVFSLIPKNIRKRVKSEGLEEYIFHSIATWLSGFRDAQFVITDSFHGTVFSIIFQKPFIAIGNKERGMARFDSLLKQFCLEDRLVDENDVDKLEFLRQKQIDWEKVNAIREKVIESSRKFLVKSIT